MEKIKENQDTINCLMNLQDLYLEIFAFEKDMESIPERMQEIKNRIKRYQIDLEHSQSMLKGKQAAIRNVEVEIETLQQQIRKYREQQLQLKSNEEFRAINNQIDNVESHISELEEKQLACMDEAEAAQREIAQSKDAMAREEGQVQIEIQLLEKRRSEVETQLEQAKAERDRMAGELNPAWLKPFKRLVEHLREAAVVNVENGICGGCHLKLPAQTIHDARRSAHVVTCIYCGRMLI